MGSVPSNKSQMQPTIPVDQSIYEVSTTQKAPLGTRLEVGDRVFYYAVTSASQARGTVLCSTDPTGSHNGALCIVADAATTGATTVTISAGSAVTALEYDEGYMGISKGTQGGSVYRIKKTPTISSAGTGSLTLYDALHKDLAASDEVGLIRNIYKNVIVASMALAGIPVCVPMVDVTAGGYFWGQTYGPAAPVNEAATPVGASLKVGTLGKVLAFSLGGTTSGCVAQQASIIGKNYNLAGTAGEYTPVFLTIRQ